MSDSGGEGRSSVSLFPRVKWIRHSTMDQASADGVLHSTPMDGWMDFSQGGQGGSVHRALRISDQSIFLFFFVTKSAYKHFGKLGHVTHGPLLRVSILAIREHEIVQSDCM